MIRTEKEILHKQRLLNGLKVDTKVGKILPDWKQDIFTLMCREDCYDVEYAALMSLTRES